MSTENTEANVADKLAQALLTGLGAAQELLEIKRKELGDDYSKTYGYWKAERELSAALAAHEAEKAQAVLPNGLTEAETAASASVLGLMLPKKAAPAAPASASEAPVAVPLTDEEIIAQANEAFDTTIDLDDETLVNKYGHGVYVSRFLDFARAIERTCADRWGVKLEGGQG